MDNFVLDADLLFQIADVIDGYCEKQREVINVYYAQIMALESEWRDDETFGSLVEELNSLKIQALALVEEIYEIYPKYFRKRAQQILERPIYHNETVVMPSYDSSINSKLVASNSGIRGYSSVSDYLGKHNYGMGDYDTYSKDPIWRALMSREYPEAKLPPLSGNSTVVSDNIGMSIKPTTPFVFLDKTSQEWHSEDSYVEYFNAPIATGEKLNYRQGVPESEGGEGVEGYKGTCGLASIENILRMAGYDITEKDVVMYAKSHEGSKEGRKLCTTDSTPNLNGGTYAEDRRAILKHFGIDSDVKYTTDLNEIAEMVTSGKGVIASVEANMLWHQCVGNPQEYHAITLTSVQRDKHTKDILGFYICDSGSKAKDSARFVNSDIMLAALSATGGKLNVTKGAIR